MGKQPHGPRGLMRLARVATLCVAIAAAACGRPTAPPREQPTAPPASTATAPPARTTEPAQPRAVAAPATDAFTPPNAEGWGSAAGLGYLTLTRGGAKADETLPMLIAIHGLGDRPRPEWFRDLGDADELVPDEEASALVEHLRKVGFDAELQLYPGVPHAITPAMWEHASNEVTKALAQAAGAQGAPRGQARP